MSPNLRSDPGHPEKWYDTQAREARWREEVYQAILESNKAMAEHLEYLREELTRLLVVLKEAEPIRADHPTEWIVG